MHGSPDSRLRSGLRDRTTLLGVFHRVVETLKIFSVTEREREGGRDRQRESSRFKSAPSVLEGSRSPTCSEIEVSDRGRSKYSTGMTREERGKGE